jgi:hypothetical protein
MHPGETVEQNVVTEPSKVQPPVEREMLSKVMREKCHIQAGNDTLHEWQSLEDWPCNASQIFNLPTSHFIETVTVKPEMFGRNLFR